MSKKSKSKSNDKLGQNLGQIAMAISNQLIERIPDPKDRLNALVSIVAGTIVHLGIVDEKKFNESIDALAEAIKARHRRAIAASRNPAVSFLMSALSGFEAALKAAAESSQTAAASETLPESPAEPAKEEPDHA